MKKYMKEIADLGSPISPKLGKCSPKFRRKILNIVKKVAVITYDNGEEEEYVDPLDEKTRKNSVKELPPLWNLKCHQRAFSLQVQPVTVFEEKTTKSNEVNTWFSREEHIEKVFVVDSNESSPHHSPKNEELETLNMHKISEERLDMDKNSGNSDDGDFPKPEKHLHGRPSLKDELQGFDFSQFNYIGSENCEHD